VERLTQNKGPVEESVFDLDGSKMRYLHAGSGPPILLVHGLLGYSFSWRHLIPELASCSEIFAVDLLGTGHSDRVPDLDCSFTASAHRMLRFLDAMCHGPIDLLGTSHGGAVALRMATLAPERINRLILVAPVNPWAPRGRKLAPFLSNALIAPLFVRIAPFLRNHYFRRLFADKSRIIPGTFEGYAAPLETPGSYDYAISILSTWNRDLDDLKSALPRISHIPTLLLWGDRDGAVSPTSAEPLKQNFQHCRLVIMKGVGHLPYEEAPDEFNRVVTDFLFSKPRDPS
jgi:pimeloyl-ACP methyl ester carboxylesterase